jgi:signal transduction histidine kinase
MLSMAKWTRTRRETTRRHRELEAALGAAHELADESVQAALTTTLLTLGNFLHELRNYQTAISADLDFIRTKANLSEPMATALRDAQEAQKRQEELVRQTVADLRARARPTDARFLLTEVIEQLRADPLGVDVAVQGMDLDFEITGNPEHLRVVLLNLVRNAEQAGATTVSIELSLEPSGHAAQILLHDDGPGVPTERRERLFDSFAVSSKPGGSGLGMYLVRRYVELLGGKVALEDGLSGGLAARIRLPGSARPEKTGEGLRPVDSDLAIGP